MRKYLFFLSILLIPAFNACNESKPDGQEAGEKMIAAPDDSIGVAVDTLFETADTIMANEVEQQGEAAEKKARIIKKELEEAPKHQAPGQSKIDSIKHAKQKSKK